MIVSETWVEGRELLLRKITESGKKYKSRFGDTLRSEPDLLVVEEPDYFFQVERDFSGWRFCGESYAGRVDNLLGKCAAKLKSSPYTRRISIPVWRPRDHFCNTPPAITEVSLLPLNGKLHATAFIRSLDAYNFFMYNADFITYILDSVSNLADFEVGSAAMLISVPHIYLRDVDKVKVNAELKEVYGYHELGTHLKEDYLSTAWHSAMEVIYYNGNRKRTEWGEIFEGQKDSKFVHRLFIEVKNPYEHQIHDKAPFTKKYGIDYAHDYMIYAKCIDKPVSEPILKEGETYTYAERARYCESDDVVVDQLYTVISKLKEDRFRRDCYVGISRTQDIESDEPPCLRGYHFAGDYSFLKGIFYMRSNDIYGAMHANAFAFSTLTQYVAELTGFEKHIYYHFAVDAHIYGEFVKSVREILEPESPDFLSEMKGSKG
jgi:thymidylate synthase